MLLLRVSFRALSGVGSAVCGVYIVRRHCIEVDTCHSVQARLGASNIRWNVVISGLVSSAVGFTCHCQRAWLGYCGDFLPTFLSAVLLWYFIPLYLPDVPFSNNQADTESSVS